MKQSANGRAAKYTQAQRDAALFKVLHHIQGSAGRWAKERRRRFLMDEELRAAIAREFGLGGGALERGQPPVQYRGGQKPAVWFAIGNFGKPDLAGQALLDAARRVLALPPARPAA